MFAIASKRPSFVLLVSCQKTSLVLLDAGKLWLPSHRRFLCTQSCGIIITIIRMIVINISTSSVIVIIITIRSRTRSVTTSAYQWGWLSA